MYRCHGRTRKRSISPRPGLLDPARVGDRFRSQSRPVQCVVHVVKLGVVEQPEVAVRHFHWPLPVRDRDDAHFLPGCDTRLIPPTQFPPYVVAQWLGNDVDAL